MFKNRAEFYKQLIESVFLFRIKFEIQKDGKVFFSPLHDNCFFDKKTLDRLTIDKKVFYTSSEKIGMNLAKKSVPKNCVVTK